MFTATKLARIISALAFAALLSGCSAIKLGYNNIDQAAYWWLDSYIDMSDAQATRVREDLGRLHLWHRTTELPRLAGLLQKVETLVAGEITGPQACQVVAEVRERLEALSAQAEPAVVSTAIDLTPAQLAHMERKYRRNNADYRKDWIDKTPAEQQDKRFKQLVERSEMIYGDLDEAQRTALKRQIGQMTFDAGRILAERERRQQDLLATLRKLKGQPLDQARNAMRGLLDRGMNPPNPAYRAWQESVIQDSCRSFAAVHATTTAAQRETAVRRLRAYQRDLRELSAQR
jgi:hypothetical protein